MPRASKSLLLDIVDTGEHFLAVGERGHILFSDDPNAQWTQAIVPTKRMLTAVSFCDAQRGWAVGYDGLILVSVNGGRDWVVQYHGLQEQGAYNRKQLQKLHEAKLVLERQKLDAKSSDQRQTLMVAMEDLLFDIEDVELALEESPYSPPLLDVYFSDELHGYAVGAFGLFLITGNGGVDWHRVSDRLVNPEQLHLNAITGSEDGRLWIAGEGGLLFFSNDTGASWSAMDSPYRGSLFGIAFEEQKNVLMTFGLRGNIFTSSDSGRSWVASESSDNRSVAGGLWLNSRYALVTGSGGMLQVSVDGGNTFHQVPNTPLVNLSAVAMRKGHVVSVGSGGIHSISSLEINDD